MADFEGFWILEYLHRLHQLRTPNLKSDTFWTLHFGDFGISGVGIIDLYGYEGTSKSS